MAVYEGCAIFCLVAIVFLGVLGILFIKEYKYLPYGGNSYYRAGITCIWAAGVYLIILFIILFKLKRSKTSLEPIHDNGSDSSDEDAPFIKINRKKKRS